MTHFKHQTEQKKNPSVKDCGEDFPAADLKRTMVSEVDVCEEKTQCQTETDQREDESRPDQDHLTVLRQTTDLCWKPCDEKNIYMNIIMIRKL